jgi:putative NIF3 family GTP cyclohydrolase 1 type 2
MISTNLTRRQFALLTGTALAAMDTGRAQAGDITARQVIERIQKNVGVPWRAETVDTFKTGNPDTKVKGIATSFSATLDVMQRGVASGKNLFIVHEPTFYNHQDSTKDLADDPVYTAKQSYADAHELVVWRFHDHWHARRPDGIFVGMTEALGWDKFRSTENPRLFVMPATTLEQLAKDIQTTLKIRAMRVMGDPQLKVSKVGMSPGFSDPRGLMRTIERPDLDVLLIGESREWEGVEYTRDALTLGQKKGLIILGHVPSEENGMKECARWLKTFVPEVPIEFIPSGEPFWTPHSKPTTP